MELHEGQNLHMNCYSRWYQKLANTNLILCFFTDTFKILTQIPLLIFIINYLNMLRCCAIQNGYNFEAIVTLLT